MRTLGDIPIGKGFPAVGKHNCCVLDAIKGVSKQKHTPQIELILSNGETEFNDQLFVTEKTFKRLCLVAQRVCNMPKDTPLPDDDLEASKFLANYIMSNVIGKNCVVTIEENEESFIPTSGPDMGRKVTKKRRRVSFNGYDVFVEQKEVEPEQTIEPGPQAQGEQPINDEELPF